MSLLGCNLFRRPEPVERLGAPIESTVFEGDLVTPRCSKCGARCPTASTFVEWAVGSTKEHYPLCESCSARWYGMFRDWIERGSR